MTAVHLHVTVQLTGVMLLCVPTTCFRQLLGAVQIQFIKDFLRTRRIRSSLVSGEEDFSV